jgi:hypothetical protein
MMKKTTDVFVADLCMPCYYNHVLMSTNDLFNPLSNYSTW